MPRFYSEDERDAWYVAEDLIYKAAEMMRNAEDALDKWRAGKEMNRLRCERKGISLSDAEIRWAGSAVAKNMMSDNSFHTGLAVMYFGAANANYTRALYLRGRSNGSR